MVKQIIVCIAIITYELKTCYEMTCKNKVYVQPNFTIQDFNDGLNY